MKIRFLGTGTSTGNPEIGCTCPVCLSSDKRDWRMRTSALIENEGEHILIDCSPDFRMQMLQTSFVKLDAVLLTHEHYDHVAGIDDLRPFCKFGPVSMYAESYVAKAIRKRIPYVFFENRYPGVPDILLHEITTSSFRVGNTRIEPVRLFHGKLPILGYRIKDMAYLTDLKTIPEGELEKLKGLKVLVINALRIEEHISHQTLQSALEYIRLIKPEKSYLIHMSHHFGLHAEMEKKMPDNVVIAYDGLEIEV